MHYGVEVVADQAGDRVQALDRRPLREHVLLQSDVGAGVHAVPRAPDHARREAVPDQGRVVLQHALRGGHRGERGRRTWRERSSSRSSWPSRATRCATAPTSIPKGPYAHIQADKGRAEAMMWAVERPDGGRGFGFTGGHFHDNWGNDDFRKVVLNALPVAGEGRGADGRGRIAGHRRRPEREPRYQAVVARFAVCVHHERQQRAATPHREPGTGLLAFVRRESRPSPQSHGLILTSKSAALRPRLSRLANRATRSWEVPLHDTVSPVQSTTSATSPPGVSCHATPSF